MRFRNGIIIAMIAFVAFIVTMAVVINSKKSELISEDYYIQEKSFNDEYDAQQRAADYKNPIKIVNKAKKIFFKNTSKLAIQEIDVTFIRMNDRQADFTLNEHDIALPIQQEKLAKGNYEVQMHYKVKNLPFMQVSTWYYK